MTKLAIQLTYILLAPVNDFSTHSIIIILFTVLRKVLVLHSEI